MSKPSVYARLASRFAHLALGAKEEDDDEEDKKEKARLEEEERDRKAREEGDDEEDEDDENASEDERKARKARNEKRRAKARKARGESEDDDDDDDDDSPEGKAAAAARASERSRWATVLSSAEAKGRVPLTCSLLADTSMSAEKIRNALLASPSETRAAHGLAARMAAVPRPDVGTGAPAAPDATTPAGRAAAIVKAYNKAVGA